MKSTDRLLFTLLSAVLLTAFAAAGACAQDSAAPAAESAAPASAEAAAPATADSAAPAETAVSAGPDKDGWYNDLGKALEVARKENKLVFVDFWAAWCGWCKKLDSDTYPDKDVQKALEPYVRVKVDTDSDVASAQKYNVSGLPTMAVLSADGTVIARVSGFLPPKNLSQFLADLKAFLDAKARLEKDPKDAEACFIYADKSSVVDMPADERKAAVAKAIEVVPAEDAEKRGKLLTLRAVTTYTETPDKLADAVADLNAAAKLDPENKFGIRETSDWLILAMEFGSKQDVKKFAAAIDKFLADYPKSAIKDSNLREQAMVAKFRYLMQTENLKGALDLLKIARAEADDEAARKQIDSTIEELSGMIQKQEAAAQSAEPATPESAAPASAESATSATENGAAPPAATDTKSE